MERRGVFGFRLVIPSPGTEYYPMKEKAYRTSQLLTHPIFHLLLILQNSAEQATKGRQVCNALRGDLRMHRPLR